MKTLILLSILCLGQKIIFKDAETKETLVGVKIENKDTTAYSNFDGEVYITDTVKVSTISYKDTTINQNDLSPEDRVIFLQKVK